MEISSSVKKKIEEWLSGPYDEETKKEINRLLKENPHDLIDAFSETLNFGTGGIRAKMGVGINRLNSYTIAIATQGLANYIKSQNITTPSVIIGFDSRKNSKEFAEIAAKVLAAAKIKVYLFKNLRPTPLVSFGCRYKECTSAIMITASHNPREYNGYKVYWCDGGQVLPPHDEGIIEEYNKIEDITKVQKLDTLDSPLIEIIEDEIDKVYIKKLFSISLLQEKQENINLKIIYSNLHGTGITLVPKCLNEAGFKDITIVKEQEAIDPNFTNAPKPNPEERSALEIGIRYLKEKQADIFIATDPDADRMGIVVNHKGDEHIFSGNQVACIMLNYICKNTQLTDQSACVKSIVTTELLTRVAESYKVLCTDVLTGFKYIAQKILEWSHDNSYDFIFGAEESLGYLIETFARDKDAISASVLLAKIAEEAKKENKTLLDLLYDIYQKHGIYREKLTSISFESSEEGMCKMKNIMEKIRSHPLKTIANNSVTFIDDYKLGKTFDIKNKKETLLTLPESNVLRYWLSDNSKLVIRPSGTEPKIKIYAGVQETNIQNLEKDIEKLDARLDALADALKLEIKC